MKVFEYSKALYKLARYEILEQLRSEPLQFEQTVNEVATQVRENGFVVFENYIQDEKCDSLRKEVDRLLNTYNEKIWNDPFQADKRLFGAERKSDLIGEFYNDSFINQIRNCYYKTSNVFGCTLAARIDAVANNQGSGGGWHRDSIYGTQFKAILYLTDVTEQHGPFQYLSATHNQSAKLDAIKKCGIRANQNRLNSDIVDKLLEVSDYKLITFTAKKGTLLLVDTTGIHRGKPILKDSRYALTNYWYAHKIPKKYRSLDS